MTTCAVPATERPPASSAYYHPRRTERPLRVGDRVRITHPSVRYHPGSGVGRHNYPGAGNYGTVVAVSGSGYYIDVRTDDLRPDEHPGSFYSADVERI